jgi:hypothetical protein
LKCDFTRPDPERVDDPERDMTPSVIKAEPYEVKYGSIIPRRLIFSAVYVILI